MPTKAYIRIIQLGPDRAVVILGYPVYLSKAVSRTNTVDTSSLNAYFRPFSKLVFGDLRGMELAIDPFGLFDKDQTRIRVTERLGIVSPVSAYFSYLKGLKITL